MLAVGWELVTGRRHEAQRLAAQRVLELNVELRPSDWNAYFELAELYWFDQQPAKTRDAYRALLAALEERSGADPALAERMRHRSETWLRLLADPEFRR